MREHHPPGLSPIERIALPLWPHGKIQEVSFYSPLNEQGGLAAWLSAGSVLDLPENWQGVYLIHDKDGVALYCGSSAGNTYQGQLRRTVAHHLQIWERRDGRPAGWTIPREYADVAVFPLLPGLARDAEQYCIEQLWAYADGESLVISNENEVFAQKRQGSRRVRPVSEAPF